MEKGTVIKIEGLHKSYGKIHALRGVDLEVGKGEIFGFLGPNGAGKTTTIRCMLDHIRPQAGSIHILGLDPQKDPVAVQETVGYLPGELNLESNLKVEQVLRYFKDLRRNHLDWSYVNQLADRLELDLTMPIRNLSKGNKQKVGIVQSLMHHPKILLMDEPTSGLDPLMQQEVYSLLREAQLEGATVFFSSHIISEVEALAERVAIIREGKIIEIAKPRDLRRMTIRRVHVRFKHAVDPVPIQEAEGIDLVAHPEEDCIIVQISGAMDKLINALAGLPVIDLEIEQPSLEEVFLAYYAGKKGGIGK